MISRGAIYLLAGTFLAAPALAQTTAPATPAQPGGNMPAAQTNQGMPTQQGMTQGATQRGAAQSTMAQPGQQPGNIQYITQNRPDLWRASRLERINVYNDRNERVGDISEVLVNQQGQVEAVVIGVGGFLGIGQRDVAVPFSALRWENVPARTAAAPGAAPATGQVGTATGAGGTMAGAPAGAGTMAGTTAAPAGTTGATGTTAGQPAAADTTGTTTGSVPAANGAAGACGWAETRGDAMRDYPERAILANATKELLESAPEFRYAR